MRENAMRGKTLSRFAIALLAIALSSACATGALSVKQQTSTVHRGVHAALSAIDDTEIILCAPAQATPWTCTRKPPLVTDAQHQQLSKLLRDAYDADIKLGYAIIAWQPNMPTPPELATLTAILDQIAAVGGALTGGDPTVARFVAAARLAIAEAQRVAAAFRGGEPPAAEAGDALGRLAQRQAMSPAL